MHQFYPTLSDNSQADMDIDNTSFTFDDEESATLFRALGGWAQQVPEIATELDGINAAEEPTTVAPLAKLIAVDCSSATTSNYVTTDSASDKNLSAASTYTLPTPPFSHSPTPAPAPVAPPAPADVGTNQGQSQEPQTPSTPELMWRVYQHIEEEAISLQQFVDTQLQRPAQMIEGQHPAPYPRPVTMYHPMNDYGHTSMQPQVEFVEVHPDVVYCTRIYGTAPPTYPAPPPAPPRRASPVSNKREIHFLEPEVPQNFVANPNNHGRWDIDTNGTRYYLNAPKTKRRRTK
jgi:hypothetical protein